MLDFLEKFEIEITVADATSGTMLRMTNAVTEMTIDFHRVGAASTLTIKFVHEPTMAVPFNDGASISVIGKGQILFKGVIFTITRDRWGNCTLIAYDYLRYLKNQVFVFEESGVRVDIMIRNAIMECGLTPGTIIPIDYKFKMPMIQYQKTAFDLINWFLQRSVTYQSIKNIYCMFHNYLTDTIDIVFSESMKMPYVIGENSLLTDFTVKSTIDEQTYTSVAILYDMGGKLGKKNCEEAIDPKFSKIWGKLRLVKDIPDVGYNDIYLNEGGGSDAGSQAFIKNMAEDMLKLYNKPTYVLTFESLGILGVRAGQFLKINIPNTLIGLNDGGIWDNFALLEKVTHKFRNDVHTMHIESKVAVIG